MHLEDVGASAEIFYEALGHHLHRYLHADQILKPEQWKAKHIAYREEMFRWWVQYGEQRGVQCRVIRDQGSREIAGFIVWQDPSTVILSSSEGKSAAAQNIPPSVPLPEEVDAKAWESLGKDYNKFLKDEYPNQSVATIYVLGIRSKYQKRGLGGQLVNAFLDAIQGREAFIVSQPVAVSLYQRHGFQITSKGLQDGGLIVPLLPGETESATANWPMSRRAL